jgi:acetyltransferase-like isoleucine patch superfamily enzyme
MIYFSRILPKYINRIYRIYSVTRSRMLYGFTFSKFGYRSVIIDPILITNPHCISVGDKVLIRNGSRLEIVFDGKNDNPSISIGNNVNIEQNVHIVCHCSIKIGNNVSITANCVIVDTEHPFDDLLDPTKIGSRISTEPSFVQIGDGCFIGTGVCILPNVRIGEGSVIGSNSVVTRDIPPYSVAMGQPARVVRSRLGRGRGIAKA